MGFLDLFRKRKASSPKTKVEFSEVKKTSAPAKAAAKPAAKSAAKPAAKKAPAKSAAKKAPAKKAAAKPAAKKDYQPQCAGLTAAGKQCANSARDGSKYCGSHKGYQPPKRATARAGTNTKPRVAGAADTAAAGRRADGKKQCAGKTKAGSQCKRDALPRGKYCATHKTS